MAGLKKGFIDIPVDKLVPADWNYKKDDDAKQEKLVNNIKRNGQVENILVRELETGFFEVVNGNHRLKAFQQVGITAVHAFNLGEISDAKARRIAIETNETRFENDVLRMADLLKDICEEFTTDELASTMPFSKDEMGHMLDTLSFDWEGHVEDSNSKENASDDNKKITVNVTPDKYDAVKAAIHSAIAEFSDYVKVK